MTFNNGFLMLELFVFGGSHDRLMGSMMLDLICLIVKLHIMSRFPLGFVSCTDRVRSQLGSFWHTSKHGLLTIVQISS